jgi:hypothetical protein
MIRDATKVSSPSSGTFGNRLLIRSFSPPYHLLAGVAPAPSARPQGIDRGRAPQGDGSRRDDVRGTPSLPPQSQNFFPKNRSRSKLSLTEFYDKHHKYVYLLYLAAKSWWGREHEEFPDLDEIAAFSIFGIS